jgi:transposase
MLRMYEKTIHHSSIPSISQEDAKKLERRRFKATALFEKGIRQAEVARRLTVSRVAVHCGHIIWRKKGKDGLRRGRPGPRPRLTEEKLAKVKQVLQEGSLAAGYDTNLWTLGRIAEVMGRKARVS